ELVIIDHEVDGVEFSSWYVHMYPDGVFVEADQEVRAGEIIAEVGTNGNSTGPHLHLEIHTQPGVVPGKGTSLGRLIFDAATPSPEPTETPEPDPTESETSEPEEEETPEEESPSPDPEDSPDPEEEETPEEEESPSPDPEEDTTEEETPEPKETTPPDIEIEEDDDEGKNDHTIDDTISRDTGVFDPSSLGVLHDPLPFLRDLGYGLAAPGACLAVSRSALPDHRRSITTRCLMIVICLCTRSRRWRGASSMQERRSRARRRCSRPTSAWQVSQPLMCSSTRTVSTSDISQSMYSCRWASASSHWQG